MIYGVHLQMQKESITQYCFGECGHVIMGAISLGEIGDLLPCRQEECLYMEGSTLLTGMDIEGEPLTVRKLKEPRGEEENGQR